MNILNFVSAHFRNSLNVLSNRYSVKDNLTNSFNQETSLRKE